MSHPRLIGLLLALFTLLVYLPAGHDSFLVYDDNDYVTDNQAVQDGLTWGGVKWAFTTGHAGNWHPITWLSHMLDCQLFGLNPGPQHLVNVLFHTANAVLLFVLLLRLTGVLWAAAFVAALFAWHPLHVESVAWIAERKDVLCAFFGLLALLAYAQAVGAEPRPAAEKTGAPVAEVPRFTHHALRFHCLALLCFALGLMSKPMLVTLPFVMLLLDYWPLRRLNASTLQRLAAEKIPYFLLAAISCVVTFLVQRQSEAVISLARVSLRYRLENAPVAVGRYLLKLFWPADLAVFYPMADKISPLAVLGAIAFLAVVTVVAWRARRRAPYVLVGWLWFLGTLVPVIGLVQVGGAAMADRYSYIPSIGVFLAVAFGVRAAAQRWQIPRFAVPAAAMVILAGCLVATAHQLRFWRDSDTLFRHALAVTTNNDVAHVNLGVTLDQEGRYEEALAEYYAAARLAPGRYQIHNNLGNVLDKLGRPEEAMVEYREAVRLNPQSAFLHDSLGTELADLDRWGEAMNEFTNAMRLDPSSAWPHLELGKVLLSQGRDAEAVDQFQEAVRLAPDNYQILAEAAHVLAASEDPKARDPRFALALAAKANELSGHSQPVVFDILGMAFAANGDFSNAQICAQNALDLATAAKMKSVESIQQRLQLYQEHQPWRESFGATNAPVTKGVVE